MGNVIGYLTPRRWLLQSKESDRVDGRKWPSRDMTEQPVRLVVGSRSFLHSGNPESRHPSHRTSAVVSRILHTSVRQDAARNRDQQQTGTRRVSLLTGLSVPVRPAGRSFLSSATSCHPNIQKFASPTTGFKVRQT
jgi:hypothetical protein